MPPRLWPALALALAALAAPVPGALRPALARTIVVNTADDFLAFGDLVPGDGVCDVSFAAGAQCTLGARSARRTRCEVRTPSSSPSPGPGPYRYQSSALPRGVSASGQRLLAVVDGARTVAETDETNNVVVSAPVP